MQKINLRELYPDVYKTDVFVRFPLSIWGQPPAKWKSAASAPTREK